MVITHSYLRKRPTSYVRLYHTQWFIKMKVFLKVFIEPALKKTQWPNIRWPLIISLLGYHLLTKAVNFATFGNHALLRILNNQKKQRKAFLPVTSFVKMPSIQGASHFTGALPSRTAWQRTSKAFVVILCKINQNGLRILRTSFEISCQSHHTKFL